MKETQCILCKLFYEKYPLQERPKKEQKWMQEKYHHKISDGYFSSPKQCAFKKYVFDSDNWSCQTMNLLREYAGENDYNTSYPEHLRYWMRDDDGPGESLGVLYVPEYEDKGSFYIVMQWYKSRGRTQHAWMVTDAGCNPLNLKMAQHAIEAIRALKKMELLDGESE